MREIKFRAWDKARPHPCMIEVESVMYDEFDKMSISGKPFDEDNGGFTHLEEGEFELLQFTGLQDKNGVDIYVGDIVSEDGLNFTVGIGGYFSKESTGNGVYYYQIGEEEYWAIGANAFNKEMYFTVIGNIHQNPELIK